MPGARHGGGYQFRLCPAGAPLTEACFAATPLEFANVDAHMVRFNDSSRDVSIPALLVTDGPAKGWMRQPVPNDDEHPCDYNVTAAERAMIRVEFFVAATSAMMTMVAPAQQW